MAEVHHLLLLDLDGTVRESASGDKFINEPTDQRLIDGAAEAAHMWHKNGYSLYGVTNQKGVLCGHKSLENMIAEQQRTIQLLPWMKVIYACPDDGETCYFVTEKEADTIQDSGLNALWKGQFRKPGPGMLMAGIHLHTKLFEGALRGVMVGDRPEDRQAAERASIPFLSAEDWRAGRSAETSK